MPARYPDIQDLREPGLGCLRDQYENAGDPHLAWGDVKPPKDNVVQIYGGGVVVELRGDPKQCSALATLICRAVKLGRAMMNELEPHESQPQSADAETLRIVKKPEKSANDKEEPNA